MKPKKTINIYKKAKKLIPGGTQLLSKNPELYSPDNWPPYFSKAKGVYVWDLDGNRYLDMSTMSVGACILGYADSYVNKKVQLSIKRGVSSSLNCPEEYLLAKKLIKIHPWFDMVRFARSGGEAMGIAVRIARSYTKKDIIFFSGYHGWEDWYLSANLRKKSNLDDFLIKGLNPEGVPYKLEGTSIPFDIENLSELEKKLLKYKDKVAAIIVEPARGKIFDKKYLNKLKKISKKYKSVLIFDEITSGFRVCLGGVHKKIGVYPDIAVFAKSIANGFAMSAILGSKKVMKNAEKTFISSTNWTERIGPTAALATIEKYEKNNTHLHLLKIGKKVKNIWKKISKIHNIDIKISGLDSLLSFEFQSIEKDLLNSIFVSKMLENKVLAFKQFKVSYAHNEIHLKKYEKAMNNTFKYISQISQKDKKLFSSSKKSFERLTKN